MRKEGIELIGGLTHELYVEVIEADLNNFRRAAENYFKDITTTTRAPIPFISSSANDLTEEYRSDEFYQRIYVINYNRQEQTVSVTSGFPHLERIPVNHF